MSEPIPDVRAAAALPELVILLHTDPMGRPLRGDNSLNAPFYRVNDGALGLAYYGDRDLGPERLAAARALFGGTVAITEQNGTTETHTLSTTWRGVPLEVAVRVSREDELETLRKELAELRTAAGQGVAE